LKMVTGYSAKNWSSLALIGPALLLAALPRLPAPTVIEDRHVLGTDLAFGSAIETAFSGSSGTP